MLFFFNETATTEIYTYRHTRSLHDAFPISLRYRGVQHYCGSQQHIEDYAERRAAIVERTTYLQSVIAALTDAGFAPAIVTGSGTGTHRIDMDLGVFTELQAGSYVFMDKQYGDCDLTGEDRQSTRLNSSH